MKIIDQLYLAFDEEKQNLQNALKERDEEIAIITSEKEQLLCKNRETEQKIDTLVRDHMIEIE